MFYIITSAGIAIAIAFAIILALKTEKFHKDG